MADSFFALLSEISRSSYLLVATVAVTVGVIAHLLRDIFFALRAKRRAQYVVSLAMREAEFRELLERARLRHLAFESAETEALTRSIEAHLKRMSEDDKKFVHQGLHQRSARGSERYLKELVDENPAKAA